MFEDNIGEGPRDMTPIRALVWFSLKAEYLKVGYFFRKKDDHISFLKFVVHKSP